jgi:hypothetical protein
LEFFPKIGKFLPEGAESADFVAAGLDLRRKIGYHCSGEARGSGEGGNDGNGRNIRQRNYLAVEYNAGKRRNPVYVQSNRL